MKGYDRHVLQQYNLCWMKLLKNLTTYIYQKNIHIIYARLVEIECTQIYVENRNLKKNSSTLKYLHAWMNDGCMYLNNNRRKSVRNTYVLRKRFYNILQMFSSEWKKGKSMSNVFHIKYPRQLSYRPQLLIDMIFSLWG